MAVVAKLWSGIVYGRLLVFLYLVVHHVRIGVAYETDTKDVWRDSDQAFAQGKCWQKDVLDLDAGWTSFRSSGQHHHHHHHHHHQYLPELEPMRVEMRPPYAIQSPNHQVTVKMAIAYGGVARLPCPVRQLGNKTVSWMKYSDDSVQLLTVGNGTYSNDNRLAIAWRYPGNWTLQISSLELHDTGCYQCQVNTHPPIGLFVYLHIRGPAVAIVDEGNISISEAVFKNGALIRLVCQVRQADRNNFSLHWKIGSTILNHDTQRGGVSVKTERKGRDAVSWLLMARANSRDSGIYSCSVDNRSEAIVSVHVIQGEQQAAVQELTGVAVRHFSVWILLFVIGHSVLY
ncbi:zwei Ig domain protein zig-8 [Daphnia magna]|uniref:zwei Ig domain protein zig-8 n=1 Tax=Daphnia magna TaxID=35525 RepID=UPI0006DFBE3A|nr:zwei Ig domain protein zig-8 [Daphnia magna]XP_045025347.1 zwei Ig domain protein zig-8 [Daphnia magna]